METFHTQTINHFSNTLCSTQVRAHQRPAAPSHDANDDGDDDDDDDGVDDGVDDDDDG